MSSPKERSSGFGGTELETNQITVRDYHDSAALQGFPQIQWRREAHRLAAEYRRTGDCSHLRAFRRHRTAMGGRMRRRAGG